MIGIGVDLAEIGRFRTVLRSRKTRFISNTFTKLEQEYCLSYRDSAPHFAGTFAAKEAVRKISPDYHLPQKDIEIRRTRSGSPEVWLRGRRAKSLYISITHGTRDALAVAFRK
jgi:holo-[acyl-carrier protein] synthase